MIAGGTGVPASPVTRVADVPDTDIKMDLLLNMVASNTCNSINNLLPASPKKSKKKDQLYR